MLSICALIAKMSEHSLEELYWYGYPVSIVLKFYNCLYSISEL